jgi:hypothetical protein
MYDDVAALITGLKAQGVVVATCRIKAEVC